MEVRAGEKLKMSKWLRIYALYLIWKRKEVMV